MNHANDAATTSLVGELVGPDGIRYPLKSAVTLVGSGPDCDILLPGLDALHAVFTTTPAGPVFRSWHPHTTLVNDAPTAARLLKTGDVLVLGSTRLDFVWHYEDPIPLTPADYDQDLAVLIDARQRQYSEWFDDLLQAREALRQERTHQGRRKRERELKRLHAAALEDRTKAKTLARRFLKRIRDRYATARATLQADRAALVREQARVAAERRDLDARATELAAREARLAEGLVLPRSAGAAPDLVPLALDAVQPESVALVVTTPDRRPAVLTAEVEHLERRAAAAAIALEKLEASRTQIEAALAPSSEGVWLDAVPLNRDPAAMLESLAVQDQALAAERKALHKSRQDLTRVAADLFDQRTVVAEQLASVLQARQSWHLAETQTLAELERLAEAVAERESAVLLRERQLQRLDADRLARAQELWRMRLKLEAWQGSLVTHEAAASADRARQAAELHAHRAHLGRWEASLATLTDHWTMARRRELNQVRDALTAAAAERARHRLAVADLDERRQQLTTDLAATATESLAATEVAATLTTGPDALRLGRQLRITQRRYERHFARHRRELEARRARLATDTATADAATKQLAQAEAAAATDALARAAAEQQQAADRLARDRELDERAANLQAELDRAAVVNAELAAVRAEVERLAGLLSTGAAPAAISSAPAGGPVVPLRLAA